MDELFNGFVVNSELYLKFGDHLRDTIEAKVAEFDKDENRSLNLDEFKAMILAIRDNPEEP